MVDGDETARPASVAEVRHRLREDDATAVVQTRPTSESGVVPRRSIARQLRSAMAESPNGLRRVLALVGPRGLGKTYAGRIACIEAHCAGWSFVMCRAGSSSDGRAVLSREFRNLHGRLQDRETAHGDPGRETVSDEPSPVVSKGLEPVLFFADDVDSLSRDALHSILDAVRLAAERCPSVLLVVSCASVPAALAESDGVLFSGSATSARRDSVVGVTVQVRTLGNLSHRETAELIAEGICRVPSPSLVDWIVKRTQGNPLFSRELLSHLSVHGHLRESLQGVELPFGVASEALPESLTSMIMERVRGLSPKHLRVTQVASLGASTTPSAIARVTGLDIEEVRTLLDDLVHSAVLMPRGAREAQVFGHVLMRDSVYDAIPPSDRARLHDGMAEFWCGAERGSLDPARCDEILAWHLYRGSHPTSAAEHALRAAAALAGDGSADEAMPHLQMLESLPLDVMRSLSGPVATLMRIAEDCWKLGRTSVCARACKLGVELEVSSGSANRRVVLALRTLLARAHVLNGDLEDAARALSEALLEAEELDDPECLAKTYYGLCMVCQMSGKMQEMAEFSLKCLAASERSGNADLIRLACCARGNALVAVCRWEDSREFYLEEVDILRSLGDTRGLATALGNLGRIHMHAGEWQRAQDYFERSIELAHEVGCDYSLGLNLGNVALLMARRGALDSAVTRLREARIHSELASDVWCQACLLSDLGALEHVASQRPDSA